MIGINSIVPSLKLCYIHYELNRSYINGNASEYEFRKIQGIVGDHSFSVVLPKSYAIRLGIGKGDFVKVFLSANKIVIEKASKVTLGID
jgi:hypothetical protein